MYSTHILLSIEKRGIQGSGKGYILGTDSYLEFRLSQRGAVIIDDTTGIPYPGGLEQFVHTIAADSETIAIGLGSPEVKSSLEGIGEFLPPTGLALNYKLKDTRELPLF